MTATHIRPSSVPIDKFTQDNRHSWENMSEVYNGRTDRSNNFFLYGIAFLDKKPTEEIGLSVRREMVSLITRLCQEECANQTELRYLLEYQTTIDFQAGGLKFSLDERFRFTLDDHFRDSSGYVYPFVGTELRLYYGEGSQRDTLIQGRTPATNAVSKDIIVLSRGDLSI